MRPYVCAACDEYRSADDSPPTLTRDGQGLVCEECGEEPLGWADLMTSKCGYVPPEDDQ